MSKRRRKQDYSNSLVKDDAMNTEVTEEKEDDQRDKMAIDDDDEIIKLENQAKEALEKRDEKELRHILNQMGGLLKGVDKQKPDYWKLLELKNAYSDLTFKLLDEKDLDKKGTPAVSPDEFLGLETAQRAWKAEYVKHGGEEAFWEHFNEQKAAYEKSPSKRYPFFSIIQSSGYGKSRLMDQLRTSKGGNSRIVYLSFGATGSYPTSNVAINNELELKGREAVEQALLWLFQEAQLTFKSSVEPTNELASFTLKKAPGGFKTQNEIDGADVLFVLDEVSQLLSRYATQDVDFFRCLRRASKTYNEQTGSFFVLLSTYSSLNQLMPGRYFDPSFKVFQERDQEILEPMAPFLIQHAIGLRNNPTQILRWSVEVCHDPVNLLTMGRPMWHALLNTGGSPKSNPDAAQSKLVDFALAKLLQQSPPPSHNELTSQQLLALFACRACLTISPDSRFAPVMVASHMATAVRISHQGNEVIVSYPSEPILALASRFYVRKQNKEAFLQHVFSQLKEYFTYGAVGKGHRGEVIVRLLNLLAIDECMRNTSINQVTEVSLGEFLSKFDRMGASISEHLRSENRNVQLTDKQKKMLKREGILETAKAAESEEEEDGGFPADIVEHGKVCFTHFVYLSDDASITPDLLQYAYRRTAALVVNAGRRGIDWIIPVRLVKDNGGEEFRGLAGQDKNRMRDTLEALSDLSNETTHHKVSAAYFLTREEKKEFERVGWTMNWPAVLFSLGSSEVGAALAKQATRKRLRGDGEIVEVKFPCIVLTSLSYDKLMGSESNEALQALRDSVIEAPSIYKEKVPLTYGMPAVDPMDLARTKSSSKS